MVPASQALPACKGERGIPVVSSSRRIIRILVGTENSISEAHLKKERSMATRKEQDNAIHDVMIPRVYQHDAPGEKAGMDSHPRRSRRQNDEVQREL